MLIQPMQTTVMQRPLALRPGLPTARFRGTDTLPQPDDLPPLSKDPWLNIRTLGSTAAGTAGGMVGGVEAYSRIPIEWLYKVGLMVPQDIISTVITAFMQLVTVGLVSGVAGGITGAVLGKKWAERALKKAEQQQQNSNASQPQ